jgi:AcrR family transcriptional regulator
MKTRDRILEGARALFNAEGFSTLAAMDLATALGISPGHLYYHFKGKGELAEALIAGYEREVAEVLAAALAESALPGATLETLWTHVHIFVEEAQSIAFFFREPAAVRAAHPGVDGRIRRILASQTAALTAILAQLDASGALSVSPEVRDGLARQITFGVAFKPLQLELEGDPAPERALLARAAAQIMLPVAGYARKKTPARRKPDGRSSRKTVKA